MMFCPDGCNSTAQKVTFLNLFFINVIVAIILLWSNMDTIYKVNTYRSTACLVTGAWIRAHTSFKQPSFTAIINVEYLAESQLVRTAYTVDDVSRAEIRTLCNDWGCKSTAWMIPQTFELLPLSMDSVHTCWHDPNELSAASTRPQYTLWAVVSFILFPMNWIIGMFFGAMLARLLYRDCVRARQRQEQRAQLVAVQRQALQRQQQQQQQQQQHQQQPNQPAAEQAAEGQPAAEPPVAAASAAPSSSAAPATVRPRSSSSRGSRASSNAVAPMEHASRSDDSAPDLARERVGQRANTPA